MIVQYKYVLYSDPNSLKQRKSNPPTLLLIATCLTQQRGRKAEMWKLTSGLSKRKESIRSALILGSIHIGEFWRCKSLVVESRGQKRNEGGDKNQTCQYHRVYTSYVSNFIRRLINYQLPRISNLEISKGKLSPCHPKIQIYFQSLLNVNTMFE